MIRLLTKKFVVGLIAFLPSLCVAAAVHINPVRIEMPPGQKNSSFKMNNASAEPVMFQLKAVKWTQENGLDVYTDTKDIIVNPPTTSIAPNDFQLVRIGLRAPLNPKTEHTYRIIANQVPDDTKTGEGFTLKTLLRISMPIFIAPKEKTSDLDIQTKMLNNGDLELRVENKSNRHLQITNIDFYKPDTTESIETMLTSKDKFVYLLPEQEKTWSLKWNPQKADKDVVMKLKTDWGLIERAVSVSSK